MATPIPCGRAQRIIPAGDGQIFVMGDVSEGLSGAHVVHFVPDAGFVGAIAFVGRARGRGAALDGVGYTAIPYHRVSLDNVAQDYAIVNAPITSLAIVQVPGAGLSVGVLVTCTAGSGVLYNHPVAGGTAP